LKNATVVPDDAVQHGNEGLYVYVVDQNNKAELRKVKISQSIDGRSVIEQGVSPGERVVTTGQFKVQPGTTVSIAVANSESTQSKVQPE
jgi:multidrug efflux system membrane fusion protein